jgi:hypothetical protein
MGYAQAEAMKANPEIAEVYTLYLLCRKTQIVVFKTQKGDNTIQHLAQATLGLEHLPETGGILDQPHRIMSFFEAFIDGEHAGFSAQAK